MSHYDEDDTIVQPVEAAETKTRRRGAAHVTVLSGALVGHVFRVGLGETVLGRGTSADIVINEDGVSRKHAKIIRAPDGTSKIRDLQSTNGTFLNGRRVELEVLREGDRIRIGGMATLDFRYEYLEGDAEVRAAAEAETESAARQSGGYDNLAATLDTLGKVYSAGRNYDQALGAYRRTLAIRERKFGARHPAVASILDNIGSVLVDKGELREGLVCHERALAIYEGLPGKPPPEMAHVLTHVGEANLRLGSNDAALPVLERASSMLQERDATDAELARVRFALARVRHARGESYVAMELAMLAREGYEAGGRSSRDDLDRVSEWIAAHGG
jgi:pSer/pThr/pTyr-binding forkhead associated (FHA) protein